MLRYSKIVPCVAALALVVLTGCQKITDQTVPEQESLAEIKNRSNELQQAADDSVNRQIAEIEADTAPSASEPADKIGQ
ncbi:MAG: hypothetical protein ACKOAM_02135 [Chakrabartia sp.]